MKKVLISIIMLIFIISMIGTVNAATGSLKAIPSASQVTKGKTFTVVVSATAEGGIIGYKGEISYDKSKLLLTEKKQATGFFDVQEDLSSIELTASNSESFSNNANLYTLTFKVLDTAQEGSTKITIGKSQLAVNATQKGSTEPVREDIDVSATATVTIKANNTTAGNDGNKDDGNKDDGNNGTGTKNPSNTNNSKLSNSGDDSSSTNTSGTKKDTKLPQTGAEVVNIIAIAGLSVFAVISYTLYKKYKNI